MVWFAANDYLDVDVAYVIGLIVGRGTISTSGGVRQITIEFPYSSLEARGISSSFDVDTVTELGVTRIRERLEELLGANVRVAQRQKARDLVIRFPSETMSWRNILAITGGSTSYAHFQVPPVFFEPDVPRDLKREFVRGYADVAGNVRPSNLYVDGRHRVRLDILNYATNWQVPVQLCALLQEHLGVAVQLITWGHPNLGRKFREHQLNIFATEFLRVGFSLEHKQTILAELAEADVQSGRAGECRPCPGRRQLGDRKPADPEEDNAAKLDTRLVGQHYDAYWQICRAVGCNRTPTPDEQMSLEFVEEAQLGTEEDAE